MKAKILLEGLNLKLDKQENPSYSVVLDLYRRSCSNPNNDTADTEVGSFSVLARTDSMTSDSGERASILTDCSFSPSRRVMTKRRLTDFNAKFVEKENWKKGHYCEVCKIDVDKTGVGRHHCRICGNAVCGLCSSRRVNSRRVCDLCFYKTKREDEGQQLQRSLSRKDEISQEKDRYIKKLKGEFLNEREKVYQLEAQIEKEELIQSQAVENQTKTKFAFLNTFNKANEIRERLASGIEINKSLIDEKESKLRSLRTKIAALKVEVAQKSFKHKELTSQFENLMTKHTSLNEISESIYSSSSRNSVLEKHYLLLLDKSDGKYQISMKPAQI